jgi:hypothetical protein
MIYKSQEVILSIINREGGKVMSIVNSITNNNVQYKPYVPSPSVESKGSDVASRNTEKAATGVSINEYGDEFKRSSIIENEDGAVFSKPKNRDDVTARVPEEEELPKIDSLVGYTNAQVERFYHEGRITRYDYDVKMEQKKEMLQSEMVKRDSLDQLKKVDTARDDKAKEDFKAREDFSTRAEAVKADVAKVETAKAETVKAEEVKADTKKADIKSEEAKDGRERVREESKDVEKDVREAAKKSAARLNARMSAIEREEREDREFEIIESGEDPAKTFRMIQNLDNLGSNIEGGIWNIA